MSAVDSELKKMNPKQILKRVNSFVQYTDNANTIQEEIVRIIGILTIFYSVPEKDFQKLLKSVE